MTDATPGPRGRALFAVDARGRTPLFDAADAAARAGHADIADLLRDQAWAAEHIG